MTADPRMRLESNASPLTEEKSIAVQRKTTRSANLWLQRIAISLFAVLCTAIGILLVLLPWSLQWTDNPLLWNHPDARTFLGYGFVRGMCSGLGLLDIWIGVREAIHYYENPGAMK